ncbi:MAG: SidJ-related pseudokinase, partial [Thermodesulfobacteriota bacterium]
WMQYLAGLLLPEGERLVLPEPLSGGNPAVLRITDQAIDTEETPDIDGQRHAICFRVHQSYFSYPNHPRNSAGRRGPQDPMISKTACRRVLSHNARLFGLLAARGIVHTAPIPLFHNRVQRHRREDRGLYEWRRGGRLDQWLASCRYPNISQSGIRDFEHFSAFEGPARRLYEHIGSHVFSLILVAGSYCRNHDPARVGLDPSGEPVDARDLFDPAWLKQVLRDVFNSYYEGFTGHPPTGSPPCDIEGLCGRLIEEMGVDRHMEEILRVAEQQTMTREEFEAFLAARGFSGQAIATLEKGRQDIQILTGPHLGGFNQRISVPELTEYAAALAALCIMDRYLNQRAGKENPCF